MSQETTLGGDEDQISLVIGGERVVICQDYQVANSFMTVPAAFTMKLGAGGTLLKDLIALCPPRTPFTLEMRIDGQQVVLQTGFTDGFHAEHGGGRTITYDGRDVLQGIHDGFVLEETSLTKVTYAGLVEAALKATTKTGDKLAELVYTNESNRKAITGAKIRQLGPPRDVSVEQLETVGGGLVKKITQAKLGERWFDFLKRHLERVGLFLWAGGHGELVISEPNTKQKPIARLVHRPSDKISNVLTGSYRVSAVDRYAEARVYVRGGATTYSRTKATGSFPDAEMQSYGYTKAYVERDTSADTKAKADFIARRRIAESRRRGWSLSYTVAGHTTPALYGGGRCAWAPDTMVEVDDEEFGLKGVYWVEGVTFKRSRETSTELVLQRPGDLVYATGE